MRHLRSSIEDMRLFERGITVRDIAEPFVSFDDGQSALEVRSIDCRVVLNGENKEVAPGATVALYLMARTLRQLFLSFLVFGRNSLKAPLEGQKFRRRGFANTEPTFPFSEVPTGVYKQRPTVMSPK